MATFSMDLLLLQKNFCSAIIEYGCIEGKITFKAFGNANRLLERKHYFDFLESQAIGGKLPNGWKKNLDYDVVNSSKIKLFANHREFFNGRSETCEEKVYKS